MEEELGSIESLRDEDDEIIFTLQKGPQYLFSFDDELKEEDKNILP
jgi:hypothetical protein